MSAVLINDSAVKLPPRPTHFRPPPPPQSSHCWVAQNQGYRSREKYTQNPLIKNVCAILQLQAAKLRPQHPGEVHVRAVLCCTPGHVPPSLASEVQIRKRGKESQNGSHGPFFFLFCLLKVLHSLKQKHPSINVSIHLFRNTGGRASPFFYGVSHVLTHTGSARPTESGGFMCQCVCRPVRVCNWAGRVSADRKCRQKSI